MMAPPWRLTSAHATQWLVFVGLSVAVLAAAGIAHSLDSASFQRFFGPIHPLLSVFTVFVTGLVVFSMLLSDGHYAVYRSRGYGVILLAIGLAVPFAAAMILVDRKSPLPADINVAFPNSLLFYPVMGYIAEILFHVLPFCILYLALGDLPDPSSRARAIWLGILFAAAVEPVFQVVLGRGQNALWAQAYVGVHVFLIGLVELLLFTRYDFITMYSFRLSYYLLWHILWGHLRLGLLF